MTKNLSNLSNICCHAALVSWLTRQFSQEWLRILFEWCVVLCTTHHSYKTTGVSFPFLFALCCPLFQGWCVLWCKFKFSIWKRILSVNLTNCICALGTRMFEKVFHHYTHTSPVLFVCLWSNMHIFTPINIIFFTLFSFYRHASGRTLRRFPSLADPEWFQFPWLYPEPVHQQWTPGLHQDSDEAWCGTRLRALQEDLLCTWHLPAWWGPGTSVSLPARLERATLWPACYQPLPGQQVC